MGKLDGHGTLLVIDSGGTVAGAPLTELDGAEPVARQLLATIGRSGASLAVADVNGDPGVLVHLGERLVAVISLGVHDGHVDRIHGIGNPSKLAHVPAGG